MVGRMSKRKIEEENEGRKRQKREYWLPPELWRIVKSYTTLYRAPSWERRCYNALRSWYVKYTQMGGMFGKNYLKIESIYEKVWKNKTKRLYKRPYCYRSEYTHANKMNGTRDLEALWFYHHGFIDYGISWIAKKED